MMKTQLDRQLYQRCERAFLIELARTIGIIVNRIKSLNESEKAELIASLSFSVACHLSGSSYGGSVDDEEVYPMLGFYKGEADESLYFGNGSMLHELVPSVLEQLAAEEAQ